MNTRENYYTDAYTTAFQAKIAEIEPAPGRRFQVVLDETFFYPTSGGQPNDTGLLDGLTVCDVIIRPDDQAVVHLLRGEGGGNLAVGMTVEGKIDWPRRFDHMQHHTGQHILSQAFIQVAGAETISFHLGTDACTIDLEPGDLDDGAIFAAERLANQVIWEDRPVTIRFVTHEEAAQLPLRKRPPVADDRVRLIEIDDFDLNACGGTHVARTGAVGQIKITGIERRKNKLRIEFMCGGRALTYFQQGLDVVNGLIGELTTRADALLSSVQKLKEDNKILQRTLHATRAEVVARQAGDLKQQMISIEGVNLLSTVLPGGSVDDLRAVAAALTAGENSVVLLGLAGEESCLLFKRDEQAPGHMGQLLRRILPLLDIRSGGGGPNFAQAGGFSAAEHTLRRVLAEAARLYQEQLTSRA